MSEKPSIADQIAASMAAVMGNIQVPRTTPDTSALEAEVARLNNELLILTARLVALETKVG